MKVIVANGQSERCALAAMRARSAELGNDVLRAAQGIVEDVRARGDAAVRDYTERFDGVRQETFELTPEQIDAACAGVSEKVTGALRRAAANIRRFHERQKQQSFLDAQPNGVMLGMRVRALRRVGLYVPGGRAAYPSSVLMNAIPAQVAGVSELVMVTPPSKDGSVNPNVLAAARLAGVSRVFAAGGAQAVAALAYGTESIPRVDKIVGPGNAYVAAAKRLVYGAVDIDMIAGPSEILIVADQTAEPKFLAADLMSQAEHDPMASAILLTTSKTVANAAAAELERQMAGLSRRDTIARSLESFGAIIVCESLGACVEIANEIAPEHLELMVENPMAWLGRVENAGSVFLGKYSPEPLGDYYAGPNHVLPTGGTARFFSPLSVDDFIKKSSFTCFTKEALREGRADIVALANAEGLTAHANSVSVRFEDENGEQ